MSGWIQATMQQNTNTGLTRQPREQRIGPCLDFGIQYTLKKSRSKNLGLDFGPCLAQIRRGVHGI